MSFLHFLLTSSRAARCRWIFRSRQRRGVRRIGLALALDEEEEGEDQGKHWLIDPGDLIRKIGSTGD